MHRKETKRYRLQGDKEEILTSGKVKIKFSLGFVGTLQKAL